MTNGQVNGRLYKAFQFFRQHAGFSTPPGRAQCALDLARAEQYAHDHDWVYEWELEQENPVDVLGEPDPVNGPFYDPTNDFVYCVLRDSEPSCHDAYGRPVGGSVLGSLGMIEESKDTRERNDYRRVVEAELALEAMYEDKRCAQVCAE